MSIKYSGGFMPITGAIKHKALPPPMITAGLVMHLDASDPASYPGAGNTWYDLSGNNHNVTLYGGYSYDGKAIQFDGGTGSYGYVTNVINMGIPQRFITADLVCKSPTSGVYVIKNDRLTSDIGEGWFRSNGGYGNQAGTATQWSAATNPDIGAPPNQYNFTSAAITVPSSTGTLWGQYNINGVASTDSSSMIVGTINVNHKNISIARWRNFTYSDPTYYEVDVSVIRIYNRVLTVEEQQQNYLYDLLK